MVLQDDPSAVEDASSGRFRLKALPILSTAVLGLGIAFLSFVTVEFLKLAIRLPERPQMPWLSEYYYHFAEFLYALVAIAILKKRRPGDYGFRAPEGKSYLGPALLCGVLAGLLMTLIDFWPQIASMRCPDQPYPLTALNIGGWFSYDGIFTGLSEETVFRGLLVTYLAQRMPGRIAFRGFSMNGAGVVVAALFALSYAESFLNKPVAVALGQLAYAFVLGVLFAYWYEKSKSLLAPIVGHNVSSLTEQALVFVMVAAWG